MKVAAVKRLCALPVKTGLGLSGSESVKSDPRYIRITDINRNGQLRDDIYASQPRSVVDESWVEPGDVLIASVGGTVGKSYLHRATGEYCFAGYLSRIRPNLDELEPRFLHYWTQSKNYWDQVRTRLVSSTIENLSASKIGTFKIPWYPISLQKIVADYLDHETAEIDASISDQIALIELLRERRLSVIDSHLMTSGSTLTPLKYLGRLRSGITLGAKYNQETQAYPYLRVANVQTDHVDLTDVATAEVPKDVAESNRLLTGDVLMTEGGDRDKLGRGALWNGEIEGMLHQNHVFAFRAAPGISPAYLVYVLESSAARYYFDATAKKSTNLASTNSTLVKNFRVPLWGIETQGAIVASLDAECGALHEAISDAQRTIDLSQERRVALISAAVTGQIDLSQRQRPAAEQLKAEVLQNA